MVEVNVAVTLGLACERMLLEGLESRNCLYKTLVLLTLTCEF